MYCPSDNNTHRGLEPEKYPVMAEVIESWVDQLLISPRRYYSLALKLFSLLFLLLPLLRPLSWLLLTNHSLVCFGSMPSLCINSSHRQ